MRQRFTLFFSWQSDIKGCRKIITDSILASCQKLKEDKGIIIDMDEATRNCPGAPKIEEAIIEKIRNSDIFVCDITPIVSSSNKHFPNPNVVYELGYAMSVLGEERVIILSKNVQGLEISKLPFDINHCRIGRFNSAKDCNLNYEIESCVIFCQKRRKNEHWKRLVSFFMNYVRRNSRNKTNAEENEKGENEIEDEKGLLKATEESTVFFARRMAHAFPGVRGLKVFTNKKEINRCLLKLLSRPLRFKEGLIDAETDPVWWFRSGSACYISNFCNISRKKLLMDTDELRIKRISVFRDSGRYYGEYVYVELLPDKPCGCYKYPRGYIEEKIQNKECYHEEYAVCRLKWYLPKLKMTRQEYDDGAMRRWGMTFETYYRADLRVRYLTPYNFIITAKGSPFNCREFDRTSGEILDGILNGQITLDEFNDYMLRFPKKGY